MARKKVEEPKKEFIPSKYQQEIFNFIKHGNGNLVINANAGCAKTTSLVKSIELIDNDKSILFCAFNTDIVKDIKKKTKGLDNVNVTTVHSLGLSIIKSNYKGLDIKIDPNKYRQEFFNNVGYYTEYNFKGISKKLFGNFTQTILNLIDLFRYNLCNGQKAAMQIIEKHDINIIGDEISAAFKLLEWGKKHVELVDYGDMVWLPNVLYMNMYGHQYDFVFGDEAQDFSVVQRELILKCGKINTRFIFAGDENQSIYAFSSADAESFNKLRSLPNTTCLTLPISYRCANKIVQFAKAIVPSIEQNDEGREGQIRFNCSLSDVQDGDMVLCRNNAPLVKVYSDFLKVGKKCYIRGKDIGSNLKTLVNSTDIEELNLNLQHDGVFVRLYDNLFTLRNKIMVQMQLTEAQAQKTEAFQRRLDAIRTLEILSENISTATELNERIGQIFSDSHKSGIALSTIHKAKGLEADNVFIVCRSLMPSKSANLDWEKEQERNLMYVAYTRAKNNLNFVDENEFKHYTDDETVPLNAIEAQVNYTLNKTKQTIITTEYAKEVVKNARKIIAPSKSNVVMGLSSNNIIQPTNRGLGLFNKKFKIIQR